MKESVELHTCYCHLYHSQSFIFAPCCISSVLLQSLHRIWWNEFKYLYFLIVCVLFFLFFFLGGAESVHRHMQQYEVEYLQFAFRWMNNLLMRELPLRCTIRLWDTYQVQRHTHTQQSYCCSAFFLLSLYLYVLGL